MEQNNSYSQVIAQWITSIAISVVCCAVLFVVFAGYIVDLHSAVNLVSVRLEVAQEKYAYLLSEVDTLKKTLVFQANGRAPGPAAPAAVSDQPPSSGVEITGPAPADPDAQTPAALPAAPPAPAAAAPAAPAETMKKEPNAKK